jgi:DNA-binding CsgD family transcriptional regulator
MDLLDGSSVARAPIGQTWTKSGMSPLVASLWPFVAELAEPVILLDLRADSAFANPAFDDRWHRPGAAALAVLCTESSNVTVPLVNRDGGAEVQPATIRLLRDTTGHAGVLVATIGQIAVAPSRALAELHQLVTRIGQRLGELVNADTGGDSGDPMVVERLSALSDRELEILRHVVAGKRINTTAHLLYVSEHTVRNHLKRVYRKLGVHSLGELRERLGNHTIPAGRTR